MLSYIGPGGALSAIGSFLALLAAVFLALLGFVWYPIKRMLRARKQAKADVEGQSSSPGSASSPGSVSEDPVVPSQERKVEV